MVARSQEDSRNASGLQSVEERLVVRDDDGPMLSGELQKRIVRGAVTFDDSVVLRELRRGSGVPVVVGQQGKLGEDRGRDRDIDIAYHPTQLRVEVDLELERHQEGVRVKQDESRHRFRASMPNYMAMR